MVPRGGIEPPTLRFSDVVFIKLYQLLSIRQKRLKGLLVIENV